MDNLHDVCRICANKIKDKKRQQHLFNYLRGKLLHNLKLITGVELSSNEGLPKYICVRCSNELDLAIKFRERCIFTQKYLKEVYTKRRSIELVAKSTEPELHEDLIDEEQLEYLDDDVQVIEDINDYVAEDMSGEDFLEETEDVEVEVTEEQSSKEKQHWVLLEDSRPSKRVRNFFICEECGEFFNTESSYNLHIKGHMQQKEAKRFFPCCKCPSTFNTKIALKAHREQFHTGDRLFKCSTCGETFMQHSAKQRHEKEHINERPYPCLECGEAFQSLLEFRAHSTSHDLRTFRCEPCNMDFRTRQNLVSHSNTYTHKRTLQQMQDELDLLCGEFQDETG
ncbi:PREDICTED: transcription factor Ouib [Drosophila arizonae]|uniref:Transcription factor Ouib n=1 Tax=Drosophila arizonae TaxID=7263 RepID=A0ABM1NM05_DROAR|nr:PREDICTED: transcription factor Ouib [Drosophila arizonae]